MTEAEGTPQAKTEESPAEPIQPEEKFSCRLEDFEPKICRPDKTAVLFVGEKTEKIDDILNALDELQGVLDMDIAVLDMVDDACQELSKKYSIDREATQLLIFQNCEKQGGVSLEGDPKEQVAKLRQLLETRHEGTEA